MTTANQDHASDYVITSEIITQNTITKIILKLIKNNNDKKEGKRTEPYTSKTSRGTQVLCGNVSQVNSDRAANFKFKVHFYKGGD